MIFRGTSRAVILALVAASAQTLASADEVHIDSAFGVPQTVNGDNHDEVARHMAECNHYMMDVKDHDQDLFESCKNEHELCTHWALSGECTTNQNEMQEMCGPACKACDPSVHLAYGEEEEEEKDEEEDEEEFLDETESEELDETEFEDADEEGEEDSEGGEGEEDATEFDEDEEDATEFDEEEEEDEAEESLAVEV